MPKWKLNIFVNAIKARMSAENKTAEIVIADYTALTTTEKTEILAALVAV